MAHGLKSKALGADILAPASHGRSCWLTSSPPAKLFGGPSCFLLLLSDYTRDAFLSVSKSPFAFAEMVTSKQCITKRFKFQNQSSHFAKEEGFRIE